MNKTKLVPSILLVFVIAALLSTCSQQDQGDVWHAESKKEAGTTTITNPENPKYGEIDLDLVENLSIGNDEDPNFQFYRIGGIIVDKQENIFVLDAGNCRVQKFDSKGKFLKTFGRKGQGQSV